MFSDPCHKIEQKSSSTSSMMMRGRSSEPVSRASEVDYISVELNEVRSMYKRVTAGFDSYQLCGLGQVPSLPSTRKYDGSHSRMYLRDLL